MSKVLIIGHNWPEPTTTAAGHRMLQLLEAFREKEYAIFFASTAMKTEFSADLSVFDVQEAVIKLNDNSFDDWMRALRPDVVVFDRFMVEEQFGWRVAESAPNALRVLNTEDLHSLRHYRETAVKQEKEFAVQDWLATDRAKREMASVFRSDLTLVVSTFEAQLLVNRVGVPDGHVLYLPFMLPALSESNTALWLTFEERSGFVCFGNGKHAPNVDSIIQLKKSLWPNIRKQLPEATLSVYGAYLPQHFQQFHNKAEGFLVKGWVEDLDAVLQQTRINLAPLRFGAGIKGKLVDAMRNGLPSITTAIGAEGMHGNLPWAGHVATDENEFIEAAVRLYQNQQDWHTAQQHGVDLINKIYNGEKLKAQLFAKIDRTISTLGTHRAHNFIGQMLQHQSLAATKFMGKWIEEKNRKR